MRVARIRPGGVVGALALAGGVASGCAGSSSPEPTTAIERSIPRTAAAPLGPPAVTGASIGLTSEGALVTAQLGPSAAGAVWIGIATDAPALPPIGVYTRGGGFDELACPATRHDYIEGSLVDSGEPNPPEVIAACEALMARRAGQIAAHSRRFQRRFRVDATGVFAVDEAGTPSPIPDAQVKIVPRPEGGPLEVSIPLAALPRMSQAPVISARLAVRPAASPLAPVEDWPWVALQQPFSLEPFGDLRARLMAPEEPVEPGAGMYEPPEALSYHPGEPAKMESFAWTPDDTSHSSRIDGREAPIYEKRAQLGDLEVGVAHGGETWVAVWRRGRVVDAFVPPGAPRAFVVRDGGIHVLTYAPAGYSPWVGFYMPRWSVTVVSADGTRREAIPEDAEGGPWCSHLGDEVEVASKTFDRIGFTGTCNVYDQAPPKLEVTWTWDGKTRTYVRRERRTPGPAQRQ